MAPYICHYGVKGQKWGIRRYQNADGTLTAAGKKRAYKDAKRNVKKNASKKEFESYRREETAKQNYRLNKITKHDLDETLFMESRTRGRIAADRSNELAKAKRDYKISRGKNPEKAEKSYKIDVRFNEQRFNEDDFRRVVDLTKRNPWVSKKLSDSGRIKLSDLKRASIVGGMEAVGEYLDKRRRSR